MNIIYFPDNDCPAMWQRPVLALGNFDGLHRGHVAIIDRVRSRAYERGVLPIALTFDPHPPRVIRPDKAPELLMTVTQKFEALTAAGVGGIAVLRFTEEMSQWEPERFVITALVEWLKVSEVWVGANFLFGHERAGNFSLLRELGARHGFRAEKIEPVRYKDFVVSSTRVRRLISEGSVDEAGALLGHHYAIDGVVVRGEGRGREIGVPTANMRSDNELLPLDGVYATLVTLDGIVYPGVTNVGFRPTFGKGRRVLETHIFDLSRDLYDVSLRLSFVRRLRDEMEFDGVEALRSQIAADCRQARELFSQISL
ncbi:MAG: bifunctional riboflavin kinase/FAD synthetase [Acidobacteriota bacterium]|nr:bifunctional riboflavin kinase/FAD synthetase [Acidobacteriota bacterium]